MLKKVQHDGVRNDWTRDEIAELFDLPFTELLTAPNAGDDSDAALLAKLGLTALQEQEPMRACKVTEEV